jgi:post-segregation antitoxin (ccd killing protein)
MERDDEQRKKDMPSERQGTDRMAELWLIENRQSIEGWNAYVAEHGLPLARFRQF